MEPEKDLPFDIQLMKKMRRCGHILHHKYSLNFSQNKILLILNRQGEMSQKTLMDEMQIQAGSISELLTKLEAAELIEKTRCPNDKRNCSVVLTEKGKRQAEEFEERRRVMAEFLFRTLNQEQKETLYKTLAVLLDYWEESESPYPTEKA